MSVREDLLLLGEIKGRLDHIQTDQEVLIRRFDALDTRLRKIERESALTGAISGGVVAGVVGLVTHLIKSNLIGTP